MAINAINATDEEWDRFTMMLTFVAETNPKFAAECHKLVYLTSRERACDVPNCNLCLCKDEDEFAAMIERGQERKREARMALARHIEKARTN
jgi:hypothetical protein